MADISCNITFNCRVFWRRFISITTWTIPHVYCFCKFSLCYQPHHYKHKLFRQQYQIFFLQSDDSASFLRAARGGNSEKVLEYLKNGIDINTCNAVSFNIQCPTHTAPVVRGVGLCFTLPRQYMREPTITLFVGFAFPFPNLKFICSHCNFARPILCQWSNLVGKFMSLQQYPLEVCLLDG